MPNAIFFCHSRSRDTVKIYNPCGSAASVVHTGAIEERCVDNHARVCDSTNVACRRQRPCLRSYAHTLYVTTMVPSDVLPKAAIVNGDTPSSFCCLATSALSAASFLAAGLLSMGSQSMAKETHSWSISASCTWVRTTPVVRFAVLSFPNLTLNWPPRTPAPRTVPTSFKFSKLSKANACLCVARCLS